MEGLQCGGGSAVGIGTCASAGGEWQGTGWELGLMRLGSGAAQRAASGRDCRETAKAVELPIQPASTPLKRGVNESLGYSTENSEEPTKSA